MMMKKAGGQEGGVGDLLEDLVSLVERIGVAFGTAW